MKILHTTIGAGVLAIGLALAAPATAAPSGPLNVDDVVMKLQAAGNTVIVNRTGTQPLMQCLVTGVRPGQTYSRYDSGYPGAGSDPARRVSSMTVYVDATC